MSNKARRLIRGVTATHCCHRFPSVQIWTYSLVFVKACSVIKYYTLMWYKWNCEKFIKELAGKPKVQRPRGRRMPRREYNIKVDLRNTRTFLGEWGLWTEVNRVRFEVLAVIVRILWLFYFEEFSWFMFFGSFCLACISYKYLGSRKLLNNKSLMILMPRLVIHVLY